MNAAVEAGARALRAALPGLRLNETATRGVVRTVLAAARDATHAPMPEPEEDGEGYVLADGHEHAFLGLAYRFGFDRPVACYDLDEVLAGFVRDGMTADEAQEFFDFNVIGAWVGDQTPLFVRRHAPVVAGEDGRAAT